MNRSLVLVGLLCVPLLTASLCVPPVDPPPVQQRGSIAGSITTSGLNGAMAGGVMSDARRDAFASSHDIAGVDVQVNETRVAPSKQDEVHWLPGRGVAIFEYGLFNKDTVMPAVQQVLADSGLRNVDVRLEHCAGSRMCGFRIDVNGERADETTTAEVLASMNKVKGPFNVLSRDMIHHGFLAPNDPDYPGQWHYRSIGLEQVWDITTGNPDIVIAVVDSGVVTGHPDLQDRLTRNENGTFAMADWVNEGLSNDGDGPDLNAEDPGDGALPGGLNTYHGTHTGGTIGAETNNGQGVAGVTWAGQILPVRALGQGLGGAALDILSAILWAVGDPNTGENILVVNRNKPAKIVNLSLGGPSSEQDEVWVATMNDIINNRDNLYPQRPIVVVAAGNAGQRAETVVPANIPAMITVGATRVDGIRANYSNFGGVIDLMAPGGQLDLDLNGDGVSDGVNSTWENTTRLLHGTSMATPHVAGVISLILSAVPGKTHAEIHDLLVNTADNAFRCNEGCGAGMIRPLQAILVAGAVPPVPRPVLSVGTDELFFATGLQQRVFNVDNIGNEPMEYTIAVEGAEAGNFQVTPTSGTVQPSGSELVTVVLNRNGTQAGNAAVRISVAGTPVQERTVNLRYDDENFQPRIANQVEVTLYTRDATDALVRVQSQVVDRVSNFAYRFGDVLPGRYEVIGVGDDNADRVFDSLRESFGAYPQETASLEEKTIVLGNNEDRTGVDFAVSVRAIDPQARDFTVGAPCTPNTAVVDCANLVSEANPDPACISTWEGGYCTMVCDAQNPCPSGSVCQQLVCGDEGCSACLQLCVSDFQCREGYRCDEFGNCTPQGF
jgi:serine protease